MITPERLGLKVMAYMILSTSSSCDRASERATEGHGRFYSPIIAVIAPERVGLQANIVASVLLQSNSNCDGMFAPIVQQQQ